MAIAGPANYGLCHCPSTARSRRYSEEQALPLEAAVVVMPHNQEFRNLPNICHAQETPSEFGRGEIALGSIKGWVGVLLSPSPLCVSADGRSVESQLHKLRRIRRAARRSRKSPVVGFAWRPGLDLMSDLSGEN